MRPDIDTDTSNVSVRVVGELSCFGAMAILAFLVVLVAFALHYPESSADWAAWMQAFGAIAAIAGSAWFATHQANREAERRRSEQREAVRAIGRAVLERVSLIEAELRSEDARHTLHRVYSSQVFGELVSALEQIPIEFAGATRSTTAFLMLRLHIKLLKESIEKVLGGAEEVPEMTREWERLRAEAMLPGGDGRAIVELQNQVNAVLRGNALQQTRLVRENSQAL